MAAYQWFNAWPLVAVLSRLYDSDQAGHDNLACGHRFEFRREVDEVTGELVDLVSGNLKHRCRECFKQLPQVEQDARYARIRASGKLQREQVAARFALLSVGDHPEPVTSGPG